MSIYTYWHAKSCGRGGNWTAIDVWKEGKEGGGGSRLPYWAIVLCRYESLKGYIHYTLLHSYSGLNAHRVKKSIIELEHSSGAILFDFYSAAEVVGACAPPLLFFSLLHFCIFFFCMCIQCFCVFPPFGGRGGNKKIPFFLYCMYMCEKKKWG